MDVAEIFRQNYFENKKEKAHKNDLKYCEFFQKGNSSKFADCKDRDEENLVTKKE